MLSAGSQIGPYEIGSHLGSGGMGDVYRAEDLTLDQTVALKFLSEGVTHDAARLAQFHNELRIARQVSHKNVCRLYDLGEADSRRFITMEYVDGEDLASLLRRIGRLPHDKAVEIARQLCAGLAGRPPLPCAVANTDIATTAAPSATFPINLFFIPRSFSRILPVSWAAAATS